MKKGKKMKWMILSVVLLLSLLVAWWIGEPLVSLAQDPKAFQTWIASLGILGKFIMVGLIFIQVVIAWIPGEVFEVGAGYAFGFWEGSLLVLIGSLLASFFILTLVRKFGRKLIYIFFSKEKIDALPFLHNERKLDRFIFLVFFIPGTPKDILTYAIGLTDMKISHFLFLSTVGRIPSVITSTITGSALGEEAYLFAFLSFVFTIVVSGLGLLVYGKITMKKEEGKLAKRNVNPIEQVHTSI